MYREMARMQTNVMEAAPANCYVPAIYDYSSHLIGWHPRYSAVSELPSLVGSACLDNCARPDCCFNHVCPPCMDFQYQKALKVTIYASKFTYYSFKK